MGSAWIQSCFRHGFSPDYAFDDLWQDWGICNVILWALLELLAALNKINHSALLSCLQGLGDILLLAEIVPVW